MKIQPTVIPDDVLAANCVILVKGNSELKVCAELAEIPEREFRGRLFRAKMNPEKMDVTRKVVLAVYKAVPHIQAVRALEWPMFTGFVRLAWKLAKRVSRWGTLEYDDAEQEAYAALVDAIYGYSKPGTQFKSFAWSVLNRRLWAAHNRSNLFGPLSNKSIELMTEYEISKQALNCDGPVTPEQVIQHMGLPEEDQAIVRDCLGTQRVCSGSSLSGRGGDCEPDDPVDYTAFRRGIDSEKDTVPCHFEIREAMGSAGLTPVEQQVVEAFLVSYHGWMTDTAAKIVNPVTKMPYSKKGISVILQRALRKIRLAYEGGHRIAI